MVHTPHNSTPPPRELPPVVQTLKNAYAFWLPRFRDFPKVERYGIGNKIEQTFLELLELVFCLAYLAPEHKLPFINKAITKLDIIKFFLQIVWEQKLLTTPHYAVTSNIKYIIVNRKDTNLERNVVGVDLVCWVGNFGLWC